MYGWCLWNYDWININVQFLYLQFILWIAYPINKTWRCLSKCLTFSHSSRKTAYFFHQFSNLMKSPPVNCCHMLPPVNFTAKNLCLHVHTAWSSVIIIRDNSDNSGIAKLTVPLNITLLGVFSSFALLSSKRLNPENAIIHQVSILHIFVLAPVADADAGTEIFQSHVS